MPAASSHPLCEPERLVTRLEREETQAHKAGVFWLTGPSGAGKSTLAHRAEKELYAAGIRNLTVLDGDRIRKGLCSDLGFSPEARAENIRRVAHVAKLFVEQGVICLCAFITPMRSDREKAREVIGENDFHEIFVDCPQEECERRDCKGFYALARKGIIKNYTGVSAPYERPEAPLLSIPTAALSEAEGAARLVDFIRERTRRA